MALEQAPESPYMIKSFISELTKKEMTVNILPIKVYVNNKSFSDPIYLINTITEKL